MRILNFFKNTVYLVKLIIFMFRAFKVSFDLTRAIFSGDDELTQNDALINGKPDENGNAFLLRFKSRKTNETFHVICKKGEIIVK